MDEIDSWRQQLPANLSEVYKELLEEIGQFRTLDLLAGMFAINHSPGLVETLELEITPQPFLPEVVALICLKEKSREKSTFKKEETLDRLIKVQKLTSKYTGLYFAHSIASDVVDKNPIARITAHLKGWEAHVRNPGFPDHHLEFSKELFRPLDSTIQSLLGFTISQSVLLRREFLKLINEKIQAAIINLETKVSDAVGNNDEWSMDKKSAMNDQVAQSVFEEGVLNLFFNFGELCSLTAEELVSRTNIEQTCVESFLALFSCSFLDIGDDQPVYQSYSPLRETPIIKSGQLFIIPSPSLFIWAVEDVVENRIKATNAKLFGKLTSRRHSFLQQQGTLYLKKLLPTAKFHPENLYYHQDNKRFETDAILELDGHLLIVEAKGNRISSKAKGGHQLKTQDHLKSLVKESYEQGVRTWKHISKSGKGVFKTADGKTITLQSKDYHKVIIVSLVLEPMGGTSVHLGAKNELGFFNLEQTSWVVSLYDLIVIADLLDTRFGLIQYIERRSNFLRQPELSTSEELDLFGYYLSNGLYIDNMLNQAREKGATEILYSANTDEIENYYLDKFNYTNGKLSKPKVSMPFKLKQLIEAVDESKLKNRSLIGLILLELDEESVKKFVDMVMATKDSFCLDKQLHDCSIFTKDAGGIGITFMTCATRAELHQRLRGYSEYKKRQLNCSKWIGIGDAMVNPNRFEIISLVLLG